MINDLIVYGGTLASLAVLFFGLLRLTQGSYHFFPSMGWCALMTLPFLFEFPLFNPDTRGVHAMAVLFFTALIFGTDAYADKKIPPTVAAANASSLRLAYSLAGAYVAITLFHMATVEKIPLVMSFSGAYSEAIDQARVDFSRAYAFFPPLRYVFNLSTVVMGVPAVLLLWVQKRKLWAAALLAWVFIYCIMGTAKGPVTLAMRIAATGFIHFAQESARKTMGRIFVALAAAGMIFLASLTMSTNDPTRVLSGLDQKMAGAKRISAERPYLIGDYLRVPGSELIRQGPCFKPWLCSKANYLTYRIFLTPIEVSARWYEYFHLYPVERITYGRSILDTRSGTVMHPAQAVSRWGFHEPFPHDYKADISYAYASLDADAYGRYGIWGIFLALVFYTGARCASVWFHDLKAPSRGVYYVAVVAVLTMIPSNASVQAMLSAQGLAPLLAVLLGMSLWTRRAAIRQRFQGLRSTSV